jgi:hypothetical protein
MKPQTLRAAVLVLAFAPLGATSALADCRIGWFRWGPSYAELRTTMQVTRNTACRKELKTLDFVAMQEITVTRPPQHGAAGKASRYDFAYKPNQGYVGPDSFEINVAFDYNGRPGNSRLSFDVDVTP